MKKVWIVLAGMVIIGALIFGAVSVVKAQSQTPTPQGLFGPGMMGQGYGGMMGGAGMVWMHDEMEKALAAKLGMTEDEIEQRLASGETMLQIAESKGLTSEEFYQWMADARAEALKAAVAAGTITQAQADWMQQHMTQQQGQGFGPGSCGGMMGGQNGGGMMGGRWGRNGGPARQGTSS